MATPVEERAISCAILAVCVGKMQQDVRGPLWGAVSGVVHPLMCPDLGKSNGLLFFKCKRHRRKHCVSLLSAFRIRTVLHMWGRYGKP